MTDKEKDIVTDILQRAMDVVRAELGPAGLDRITVESLITRIGALERPVRQHWRGADVYIAAKPQHDPGTKAAALAEVQRTGNVKAAAARHGISRTIMYELLKRSNSGFP